jgi:DNA polymerase III delta subunit
MENFILITGNDTLAIKSKAESIVDSLKEQIVDEYAFEIITGDTEKNQPMKVLEELSIAVNTPSFFGSSKTIWVKHFSNFDLATGKDKKNKLFQETFKEIIETLQSEFLDNNSLSLVIDGPELDRRTSIYKFFTKHGKVHHLTKIDTNDKNYQAELRNKIQNLCKLDNVKINYDATEFLADTVGSDTGRLTGEIAKLISYVGTKKNISLDNCQSICSKSFEMANWVFADALANKNIKSSFKALSIIIDKMTAERNTSSSPELSMLFGAIRKFQDLLKIKSGAELLSIPPKCQYPFF